MFALVALLCLYMGGNNIRKAFALASLGQWESISWILLIMGIVLIIVGILCVMQALKDYKNMEAEKAEKEKAEKEKRQRQFFYDELENNTDEKNE